MFSGESSTPPFFRRLKQIWKTERLKASKKHGPRHNSSLNNRHSPIVTRLANCKSLSHFLSWAMVVKTQLIHNGHLALVSPPPFCRQWKIVTTKNVTIFTHHTSTYLKDADFNSLMCVPNGQPRCDVLAPISKQGEPFLWSTALEH